MLTVRFWLGLRLCWETLCSKGHERLPSDIEAASMSAKVLDETVARLQRGCSRERDHPGGSARCCGGARNGSWCMRMCPPEQAVEQVGECSGPAVKGFTLPGQGADEAIQMRKGNLDPGLAVRMIFLSDNQTPEQGSQKSSFLPPPPVYYTNPFFLSFQRCLAQSSRKDGV